MHIYKSIRFLTVTLSICLSPILAYGELECNLNTGSINTLQLGSPADKNSLAAVIGIEPIVRDDFFPIMDYVFPQKGIGIGTAIKNGAESVCGIAIFFVPGTDFWDDSCERYAGVFVPPLDSIETVNSIRTKLGVPTTEYLPDAGVSAPSKLIYRKPFGSLSLLFAPSGKLVHINIDPPGPGEKSEGAPSQKTEPPMETAIAQKNETPQKKELLEEDLARKVDFKDSFQASGEVSLTAKEWTAVDKQKILSILAEIRSHASGLVERAVGYRTLSLCRTTRIGREDANALTLQEKQAIFIGDSFFECNTDGQLRILTHEITHLADAFGRYSDDPAWLQTIESARGRVEEYFQEKGMTIHQAALAGKSEYNEVAVKEGFFSLWSCLSPAEALADFTADLSLGKSSVLSGVDDFIRKKILSSFVPDPWEGKMHSGLLALEQKKWDEAIAAFSDAARSEPNLGVAFLFRADAWEKKGVIDRAIDDLGQAIDKNYGGEAFYRRAKLYIKNNETDKAIADLTGFIKRVPWMERGYELRASAYRTQGDTDHAISDYTAVIELSPENTQAIGRRGDLWYVKKEYEKAIDDFSRVIEKDAANAVTAYIRRGMCRLGKSDFEKAIADFSESLRLEPSNTKALEWRGNAFLKAGNLDRAITDLDAALKIAPQNWNAYGLRMETCFAMGDYSRVIADAETIIRLNPKNVFAYQMRGKSLLAKEKWAEAEADFAKIIELDPKNAVAHWGLGEVCKERKEWDRAVEAFTRAIEIDPRYVDAYVARAKINEQSSTPFNPSGGMAAVDDYSQAITLEPNNANLYYAKGIACTKAGMFRLAQGSFYQAVALAPKTLEFYIAKANAELVLWYNDKTSNWIDSALVTLNEAQQLAPENQEILRLLAKIESEKK